MANLIKFKIGSTAPAALELGEPAFDIVGNKLYIGKGSSESPVEVGGGSSESYLPLTGGTIEGDLAIVADSSGNGGSVSAEYGGFETLEVSLGAYIDGNLEVVEDNTSPGGEVKADYFKGLGYSIYQNGSYQNLLNVVLDMVYPVGAIYISTSSTSPATLFGGTWSELKGRFLLGRSTSYTAGSTGGEATHTLTLDEAPSHTHSVSVTSSGAHNHTLTAVQNTGGTSHSYGLLESWLTWSSTRSVTVPQNSTTNGSHTHTINETSQGGGGAHNNMPPYLVVYMWKRTA